MDVTLYAAELSKAKLYLFSLLNPCSTSDITQFISQMNCQKLTHGNYLDENLGDIINK